MHLWRSLTDIMTSIMWGFMHELQVTATHLLEGNKSQMLYMTINRKYQKCVMMCQSQNAYYGVFFFIESQGHPIAPCLTSRTIPSLSLLIDLSLVSSLPRDVIYVTP